MIKNHVSGDYLSSRSINKMACRFILSTHFTEERSLTLVMKARSQPLPDIWNTILVLLPGWTSWVTLSRSNLIQVNSYFFYFFLLYHLFLRFLEAENISAFLSAFKLSQDLCFSVQKRRGLSLDRTQLIW